MGPRSQPAAALRLGRRSQALAQPQAGFVAKRPLAGRRRRRCRSQAAGTVIQGIGYAHYGARKTDPSSGHVLSAGMEDYRIPGIADVPRLHVRADLARDRQCDLQCVHFDEAGFDHLLGGSVGVGEVATAIAADAVSLMPNRGSRRVHCIHLTEIPFRPDRLVAVLKGRAAA